jgi:hypothetical protein
MRAKIIPKFNAKISSLANICIETSYGGFGSSMSQVLSSTVNMWN